MIMKRVTTNHAIRYPCGEVKTLPGELLTMSNGELWFHPFSGSAPVQIKLTEPKND